MPSGEIESSSSSQIEIPLKKRPSFVKVHFKNDDEECRVPCNPAIDELEWSINETVVGRKRTFSLVISWSVSDNRTIFWHVQY